MSRTHRMRRILRTGWIVRVPDGPPPVRELRHYVPPVSARRIVIAGR